MTWDPDDFYDEPSEFDQQIDEFRQTLLKAVKTNFITKMEQLEKENEELQEVKKNLDQIKRDYASKERQLERDRAEMSRKIKYERLSELMKDFEVILYQARSNYVRQPKCDRCDDNRKIAFKTPLGKDAKEDCPCNIGNYAYYPKESICSSFENRNGKIAAWYKSVSRDGDGFELESSQFLETMYEEGMEFEGLNDYRLFFNSKEECQKYCDWLTEQKEIKGAVNQ